MVLKLNKNLKYCKTIQDGGHHGGLNGMYTTGHCLRVSKTGLIAKGKVDNRRLLSNNFLEFLKKTIVQIFMINLKKEISCQRKSSDTQVCTKWDKLIFEIRIVTNDK